MNIVKICKIFFLEILGVFGVILIFIGMIGLFFENKYQYKVLYLIFSLVGYAIIVLNFYLRVNGMNKKEFKLKSSQKEK